MILVTYFKIKETAMILKGIAIFDSRYYLVADEMSTLIMKFAHWHHLVKQFDKSWFSFSSLVTTAASSAN